MRSSIRYVGMGCLALLAFACGDKGDDNGTGGSAGSGGGSVTGGGAGTGGTGGTGGTTGGAGGTTGGSAGTGGTADSGAGPVDSGRPITQNYSFETDIQMWKFQYASIPPGDAGAGIPLLTATDVMITQDPDHGNPAPGALQLGIPYSTRSQYVGVGVSYGSSVAVGVNLTGKIITAKVQLVSGLGSDTDLMTNPGGAKLYIKSGSTFSYAASAFTNLSTHNNWIDLDFDLSTKTSWSFPDTAEQRAAIDISDVRELGIQFDTGGMAVTATPAVILIDSVQY